MLAPLLALAVSASPDLLTTAEKSGFERTGRYDEAVALCRAFAAAHPRRARCFTFGETPEGRPMVALAASADGVLDAKAARARKRPVVLFHGAIHAGELDGKDAGFMALRPLLASKDGGALGRVTAVFVPVFNVDGHERFGPDQRPNQRGPAEGGWRTNAQNLNLNRDYVKADAPETRAMLRLLSEWDPVVYADLHVTDGSKFRHDVSIMVEPRLGWDASLRPVGDALSQAIQERMTARGHLPLDFYPSFEDERDPTSGFATGVAPPRFSQSYWANRNRLGILYEAHSWRPYAHRVKTAVDFVEVLLALGAERGAAWRAAEDAADAAANGLAGKDVVLAWSEGERVERFAFQGYAYTRPASVITGTPIPVYDEGTPAVLDVPVRQDPRPSLTVTLPAGGWIVPAAHAARLEERLRLHGVRFERVAATVAGADVEAYRADTVEFGATSNEGRQRLTVKGAWRPERHEVRAGALWIPAAQPRALMAASLLEPEAPDSFLAWGEFNPHFVRAEYIEPYVLETWAREQLKDPAVKAEFERAFPPESPTPAGKAPAAGATRRDDRLDWWARRHPSWDRNYRRYPVLRAAARP
ncbi:MAG: M14 family zinc carboxypeptidase [Anaeromyxobacteraceae bacterium]